MDPRSPRKHEIHVCPWRERFSPAAVTGRMQCTRAWNIGIGRSRVRPLIGACKRPTLCYDHQFGPCIPLRQSLRRVQRSPLVSADLTGYMDSNSGCTERDGSDIMKSRRGALPTHSLCCSFHLETERGATTDDVSPSLARANGCMYTQKRRRTVICLEVLVLRCYVTRRGVQFMHVEIACVSAFIDVWNSEGSTSARAAASRALASSSYQAQGLEQTC